MNKKEAFLESDFDFKGNCSQDCPLECVSTTFDISQTESLNYNKNGTVVVSVYYTEYKYTEISQTVKITLPDFISISGGVISLFLELSFISIYRMIVFIFNL